MKADSNVKARRVSAAAFGQFHSHQGGEILQITHYDAVFAW
jgi:hypothetical protein